VACGLTLTLAGQSFAAGIPFTDISNVSAKDKILALQNDGYVNGVAEGLFAPNGTIKAAEGVQLIVNTFKLNTDTVRFFKEPKATDYYPKADNDGWYAKTLIIAAVNGMELPHELDPDHEMTKEEYTYYLIKSMEKYQNLPMINLVPVEISDQDQMTVSYSGAIQRAIAYGITKLDAAGNFNPQGKISRAEAAEQIYNALEYMKAHTAQNNVANQKLGVRGIVKNIVNGKDGITFLVEGKVDSDTQYNSATVTVNRETVVLQDENNISKITDYREIKEGCMIEVKFRGNVSKSDPIMAVADTVRILNVGNTGDSNINGSEKAPDNSGEVL
jgi:hypothetical protein